MVGDCVGVGHIHRIDSVGDGSVGAGRAVGAGAAQVAFSGAPRASHHRRGVGGAGGFRVFCRVVGYPLLLL